MSKYWNRKLSNISPKATIGKGCTIHAGVHIHDAVTIGDHCKIQAGAFLPNGVILQDHVFVGPHVVFTNDPDLVNTEDEFAWTSTLVEQWAKIGANATILAGIIIGEGAVVGAGAVVTKDIPDRQVWVGNPAKPLKQSKVKR